MVNQVVFGFSSVFRLFSGAYERNFLPACALICHELVSVASTGCNNVHESLIPVLSRRVCGFYVYIVPSAAESSCRIFVKLPLNALVFLVFRFWSRKGFADYFFFFFPPPFNSVRLSSTKSGGQFVLF